MSPPADQAPTGGQSSCRLSRWLPLCVFLIALTTRLIDFDSTAVTYDELAAKDSGPWWQLLGHGNLLSPDWGYHKPTLVIMRWIYGVLPEALFNSDPSDPYDLAGTRLIAAVLASLLVVWVFLLGREFGGARLGALAALLYCFFPAILGHDRFASHDLPARLASLTSLVFLVRHLRTQSRRHLILCAILAGASFAAYFRVGVQTIAALQAAFLWNWFAQRASRSPETILQPIFLGVGALAIGYLLFTLAWPYAWTHPIGAFAEQFSSQASIAGSGGNLEWYFGNIRPVPPHYYLVTYLCTMPILVLMAHIGGLIQTWRPSSRGHADCILWTIILVPTLTGIVSFRSTLNHYLLICYPSACVLAAMGIRAAGQAAARLSGGRLFWQTGLASLVLGSELLIAARIHPFHLDFFNILVGGTRTVAERHTFVTGWYGEPINPLFNFVNGAARTNALVNCRLAAWPGLADLRRNLRPDLDLQGGQSAHPLGADYVLRVGLETCDQFYRHNPDPQIYEKITDILAMGGSIGDVWRRRPDLAATGLVYADDFSTPQLQHFAKGIENLDLNTFSDGKLFPTEPFRPARILFCLPAKLLGDRPLFQVQTQLQIERGTAAIHHGASPTNLLLAAQCANSRGALSSPPLQRPGAGDLWILLEMQTAKHWDGNPKTFWNYDWFDSLWVQVLPGGEPAAPPASGPGAREERKRPGPH